MHLPASSTREFASSADATRIIRRAGWVGMWCNVFLTIFKIAAGLSAQSHALIADGVESLTDIITNLLLVIGVKYWNAPPDSKHPHGHKRLETLFTAGIGLMMLLVALGIGWRALTSLHEDSAAAPGGWAFAVALLTVLSKEALFRWTLLQNKGVHSPAMVANAWHHRSDAISSLPVVLAIGLAWLSPAWAFVDKVGAVVVSVFIAHAAWKILGPAVNELMDRGASEEEVRRILELCCNTPEVRGAHDVRTRYLSSGIDVSLHLQVDPHITVELGHAIAHAAKGRLMEAMPDILDVTIHIEPYGHTSDRPPSPGLSPTGPPSPDLESDDDLDPEH